MSPMFTYDEMRRTFQPYVSNRSSSVCRSGADSLANRIEQKKRNKRAFGKWGDTDSPRSTSSTESSELFYSHRSSNSHKHIYDLKSRKIPVSRPKMTRHKSHGNCSRCHSRPSEICMAEQFHHVELLNPIDRMNENVHQRLWNDSSQQYGRYLTNWSSQFQHQQFQDYSQLRHPLLHHPQQNSAPLRQPCHQFQYNPTSIHRQPTEKYLSLETRELDHQTNHFNNDQHPANSKLEKNLAKLSEEMSPIVPPIHLSGIVQSSNTRPAEQARISKTPKNLNKAKQIPKGPNTPQNKKHQKISDKTISQSGQIMGQQIRRRVMGDRQQMESQMGQRSIKNDLLKISDRVRRPIENNLNRSQSTIEEKPWHQNLRSESKKMLMNNQKTRIGKGSSLGKSLQVRSNSGCPNVIKQSQLDDACSDAMNGTLEKVDVPLPKEVEQCPTPISISPAREGAGTVGVYKLERMTEEKISNQSVPDIPKYVPKQENQFVTQLDKDVPQNDHFVPTHQNVAETLNFQQVPQIYEVPRYDFPNPQSHYPSDGPSILPIPKSMMRYLGQKEMVDQEIGTAGVGTESFDMSVVDQKICVEAKYENTSEGPLCELLERSGNEMFLCRELFEGDQCFQVGRVDENQKPNDNQRHQELFDQDNDGKINDNRSDELFDLQRRVSPVQLQPSTLNVPTSDLRKARRICNKDSSWIRKLFTEMLGERNDVIPNSPKFEVIPLGPFPMQTAKATALLTGGSKMQKLPWTRRQR